MLLIAVDGMGGHADGAKAAQLATETVRDAFNRITHPVFDPIGFLHLAIGRAHVNLVTLGARLSLEARPRATCALCLVQDDAAFFAHVGDSRIYHLRNGAVRERTRDHSHVELLLQEGVITGGRDRGPSHAQFRRMLPRRRRVAARHDDHPAEAPGARRCPAGLHRRLVVGAWRRPDRRARRRTAQPWRAGCGGWASSPCGPAGPTATTPPRPRSATSARATRKPEPGKARQDAAGPAPTRRQSKAAAG